LDILSRSGDIRKVGRCKKSTEILHVFGPQYFLGKRPPKFLDLYYKIEPDSDDVAKFGGDRPMDLGDWALNKKKHHG